MYLARNIAHITFMFWHVFLDFAIGIGLPKHDQNYKLYYVGA